MDNFSGNGSGFMAIAGVIARVFPTERSWARKEAEGMGQSLKFGPHPKDHLTYRGRRVMEYQTDPHSTGLGSTGHMRRNGDPIGGVAIRFSHPPDEL